MTDERDPIDPEEPITDPVIEEAGGEPIPPPVEEETK